MNCEMYCFDEKTKNRISYKTTIQSNAKRHVRSPNDVCPIKNVLCFQKLTVPKTHQWPGRLGKRKWLCTFNERGEQVLIRKCKVGLWNQPRERQKKRYNTAQMLLFYLFQCFFLKMGQPSHFFLYFWSFQTTNTIFTTRHFHPVYSTGIRTHDFML